MRATAEDIAAIRTEDGGLKVFIDALVANRPTLVSPPPPAPGAAHGPLHKPGAWPAGTRSDRPTCHPDCDCSLAPVTTTPAHQTAA